MLNFATFSPWTLVACTLWHGSLGQSFLSARVVGLQDLCSNMCDIVKAQNQGNTCDADNEIKANLRRLEVKIGKVQDQQKVQLIRVYMLEEQLHGVAKLDGQMEGVEATLRRQLEGVEATLEEQLQRVEAKLEEQLLRVEATLAEQLHGAAKLDGQMEDQLQGVEATLRGQLQEVEAKLEGQLYEGAKLKRQLQGVEAKLEEQLQGVEAKLERQEALLTYMERNLERNLLAVQTKQESALTKIENQLQAILNMTKTLQQTANVDNPVLDKNITLGFSRIGNRYFRIEQAELMWDAAEKRCRDLGGYLASFRNEAEFTAVTEHLSSGYSYWLGIHYLAVEGNFISVASGKPAQFLKWLKKSVIPGPDCVYLETRGMVDNACNMSNGFICQADNET